MCGIALIISGIRIDLSSILVDATSPPPKSHQRLEFSVDDLKAALRRRGPDSLGSKKLLLHSNNPTSIDDRQIFSVIEDCSSSVNGKAELLFIGATLQLRGLYPIFQPFLDSSRNILVYNGEIFDGIHVGSHGNDGEVLMHTLAQCYSYSWKSHNGCEEKGRSSVVDVLSSIKGPWALIYWQDSSKTLWFGRDALGRRSLLVHWPTEDDARFLLSSVSPPSSLEQNLDPEVENGISKLNFWEELPCGVYSLSMDVSELDRCFVGELRKHKWTNAMLMELIKWERILVEPTTENCGFSHCVTHLGEHNIHSACSDIISESGPIPASVPCSMSVQRVLNALRKSVMQRSSLHTIFQAVICGRRQEEIAPVAVLFSGGLDSMILAALLNECLDPSYEIDLLNVSFDGQFAPDRISAKAGLKELRGIAPLRRWKLVEIDSDLSNLTSETKHVVSLINPANTYMDLNIGIALWLAAGGDGWVYEGVTSSNDVDQQRVKYISKSRIILVGSGADEQCAGYGRHRTKYKHGSWVGLDEEMKLDMQRIWKRNLGRDDRCCGDNGKEARFPFLDEDVIRTLLDIPLWEIANLDQPSGTGDKKILREVAKMLGLYEAATLPKRAIQFGSRIARESNRKNFGSNRAANQASAGSVVIRKQNSS